MLCQRCNKNQVVICRPKDHSRICKICFFYLFENDIHNTIINDNLFTRGETILLGVSGGKDSTVLAYTMDLLNQRHDYGVKLHMVCVDEGIEGYRDFSLEMVKQNQKDYGLELDIISFKDMFGVTMDDIMKSKKSSCTYCGVFRRQALEEGAKKIGAQKIVTGHNADDMAETVLLNFLRGDYNRLKTCTASKTNASKNKSQDDSINIEDISEKCGCSSKTISSLIRLKPFKFIYEKEIVFYAFHKNLKYFATECTYSHGAHREYTRIFLRSIDSRQILKIIKSGEYFQKIENNREFFKCVNCGKKTFSSTKKCKSCVLLESLKNIQI